MNKHDQRRKDQLIKTLRKAKEQAKIAYMYLDVNGASLEERHPIVGALNDIDNALEQLTEEAEIDG